MRKKTIVTIPILSVSIRNILSSFSKSRSLPQNLVKRSRIVLLASQGVTILEIATQVGMHSNCVSVWRNRFQMALPVRSLIESGSPKNLEDEVN